MSTHDEGLSSAKTILKLHEALVGISELTDFPERISEPLGEVIPFDRLCVFLAGDHDSPPALITKHAAPLAWEAIHPGITTADLHSSILFGGKPGDIFLSQDMSGPGCEGDLHALELIRLKSGARFSMHLILSVTQGFRLFLSLFHMHKSFTRAAVESLGLLAPALTTCAHSLLAVMLSASEDLLLSGSKKMADSYYLLLDHELEAIGLPESTGGFLATHFHDPFIRGLPAPLRAWLDHCKTMGDGHLMKRNLNTILNSSAGSIDCTSYALEDHSGKTMVLIALRRNRDVDDFTSLGGFGLTRREIQVLGSLYAGKTNTQIGKRLGIQEITVRKHLRNIGGKLHASGRAEILAKAIQARDDIPSTQCLPATQGLTSHHNRIPPYTTHSDTWSDTVIDLHRPLLLLGDFDEAPELLRSVLAKHLPSDWAAIYCLTTANEIEKIFTSPGVRCDWAKLYPAIRKFIRWAPLVREGEPGEIFLFQDFLDPNNEQDLFSKTVVEESTGAFHALHMPIAKTHGHRVFLGLYRNDRERIYTQEEVAFVEKVSPIILTWAQALVRLREGTIRQIGSQFLLAKEQVRALLLDRHLCDVMWTKDALSLIIARIGSDWRELLLPRLREWIKRTGWMLDERKDAGRPWPEHLILDSHSLACCAYPLDSHILITFKSHSSEPFNVLGKCGLTTREIQVLGYLPLGYTNRQIASAMNIREVTVKKHMGHIGHKLNAVGRTAIMRQAEVLKSLLSE